jgi:hypothetical protein
LTLTNEAENDRQDACRPNRLEACATSESSRTNEAESECSCLPQAILEIFGFEMPCDRQDACRPNRLEAYAPAASNQDTCLSASAEKNGFYRGDGEIEDFGDFLVAKLLIASQNQGHALALRELGDRVVDRLLELGLQK